MQTENFELYLSSQGKLELSASSVQGDNVKYIYDPSNPVRTIGGNLLFGECGPKDQSSLYTRSDIVSFVSDTLTYGVFICGKMDAVKIFSE